MTSIYESFSIQNVSTKGPLTLKATPAHCHNDSKMDKMWTLRFRSRIPYFTTHLDLLACSLLAESFFLVGWLCLPSHRPRGHLETALSFTVLKRSLQVMVRDVS